MSVQDYEKAYEEMSRAYACLWDVWDNAGNENKDKDKNKERLKALWSPDAAQRYAATIVFDPWQQSRSKAAAAAAAEKLFWEQSPRRHAGPGSAHGTIVIGGQQYDWWLRGEQEFNGQLICIDTDDKDDWRLNWVWRDDYLLIKYLIIAVLNESTPPESRGVTARHNAVARYLGDKEHVRPVQGTFTVAYAQENGGSPWQ